MNGRNDIIRPGQVKRQKKGKLVSASEVMDWHIGKNQEEINKEGGKVDDVKVNGVSVLIGKTANITVPTKVSDLENDSDYATQQDVEDSVISEVEATIDNNVGTPDVDVTLTGNKLILAFQNILGDGIASIQQTTTSQESGGVNVVTVTTVGGKVGTFQILNGEKGDTVILGEGVEYTLYNGTGQNTDGAMTQKAVTDVITEIKEGLINSEQELISIVDQVYFTASSPTITTYSVGFQVLYIPVKQGQKVHITATNSSSKAFNYGFTSNLPIVEESVLNAVSVNTDNIDLTLVANIDGYFVVAKYLNYFANLDIKTEEPIFEKITKDINFSASYLGKEAIYSKQSPFDFTQYHIIKGSYDIVNGTGSYYNHASRSCTMNYIPVKKLSRIQAIMATGFQLNVIFYKVQADGTISYLSAKSSTDSYLLNTAVPIDADVAKLSFYPIGDRAKVEITDVTTSNFNITMTVGNIVTKQDVHFVLPDNSSLFKINDNGGWTQGGLSITAIETTRISNTYPIKVIPGHRYTIEATPQNMNNLVVRVSKSSFVNADVITLPDVFAKRTTINTHQMTVVIPRGYEYMWMVIVPSATNITPEDGETMDFRVIDVSGDLSKMQRAKKIADLHTQGQTQVVIDDVTMTKYSQGMACDGGYLFQGYSTGEVEVYDLNTMEYISTFVIHYGYHLGQITFGEKVDETDEFRTLWTDNNGSIYGYKIARNGDTFTATLIKTITAPTKNDIVMQSYALDFTNNKVVLYGYLGNTNASVEMTLYSISDFEDDATFTEESSIIYPCFGSWPFQSGLFRDGKLYMVTGTHQQNARIYCFDFSIGDAVNVLDLRRESFSIPMKEEPQGIDVYNGSILFSGSYSIYELFL